MRREDSPGPSSESCRSGSWAKEELPEVGGKPQGGVLRKPAGEGARRRRQGSPGLNAAGMLMRVKTKV